MYRKNQHLNKCYNNTNNNHSWSANSIQEIILSECLCAIVQSYNDLRPSVFTSYCLTQNHCHYVKYKSLENSSLNKFQVIVFETIAIKCWKMNWCSFMFWNSFVQLKIMTMYFQSLQYLEVKLIIITIFYYFLKP